jgi:hypothetical protein
MTAKHLTWTPQIQAAFLEALALSGNVRKAAAAIRRSPATVYDRRKKDPAFAQLWDETLQAAMDTVIEPEAIRRAVEGVAHPVYFQGAKVGTRQEYSDLLLLSLLKAWKPDRYRERREVTHAGAIGLLRKLEQVGKMSPDELATFLKDVEQHVNALEPETRP